MAPAPSTTATIPSRRFAAFDNRNFRLYFGGQTISSIGSWTHALAGSRPRRPRRADRPIAVLTQSN